MQNNRSLQANGNPTQQSLPHIGAGGDSGGDLGAEYGAE